jgi:hypothetical protein
LTKYAANISDGQWLFALVQSVQQMPPRTQLQQDQGFSLGAVHLEAQDADDVGATMFL